MAHPYRNLLLQTLAGGIIMYLVMFAMIDGLPDFRNNLNMFYMALMMVAPMVAIMIAAMRGMYPSRKINAALIAGSAAVFLTSFTAIRTQAAIGDRQFLRSMIPHHSGAILMCREAALSDGDTIDLCRRIIISQRAEIDEMEAMLRR
jgi:uncharacterized protein (DUF305 family)